MSTRIPIIFTVTFIVLAILALLAALLGSDSLSGVFVVILGMPWVQLIHRALDAVAPRAFTGLAAGVVTGVLGMGINTVLIYRVSKWLTQRLTAPRSK